MRVMTTAGRAGTGIRLARRATFRVAGIAAALVFACLILVAGLALTETRIVLPAALVKRIEARIDARLGDMQIDLGHISVMLDARAVPRLFLEDLELSAGGEDIAALSEVGLAFDTGAALRGRIAPRALRINGARLIVRRDAEGRFELSFGRGGGMRVSGAGQIFDAAEAALDRPPFDRVRSVTLGGAEVSLEDARSGRVWQVTDGRMALDRAASGLEFTLNADIFNGSDDMGRVQVSAASDAADSGAELKAAFDGIAARDVAAQTRALEVLGVLDAPVSGAIRTELDGTGALENLAGTLRIGAGALDPGSNTRPVRFSGARLYVDYDPESAKLEIPELSVDTEDGSASLSGHIYLREPGPGGVPGALLGQFAIDALEVSAPELYPAPVSVAGGTVDARLRLDPFRLEIGEVALPAPDGEIVRTVRGRGRVAAGPKGWDVAMDLSAGRLGIDRVRRFWPRPIASKVLKFVTEKIATGEAIGPALSIRYHTGWPKPVLRMSLAFEGAEVRAVPFLPPVTAGRGFVELFDNRFAVRVDAGEVTPEGRGPVSLAGTTFVIPDTRIKPAPAEIEVASAGPLPSALALLDEEPLRLLSRADRSPDLVQGELRATTRIGLVLQRGNTADDIDVESEGVVTDLRSDRVVPGRELAAERLEVAADKRSIRATGRATLSGVAFDGAWRQALSGDAAGTGTVEGRVAITPEGLDAFGIALPDGLVSGRGEGRVTLDLAPGAGPAFRLGSDLEGIGLRIAAVNWSKSAEQGGSLLVAGQLGDAPAVDRLEISAPGLDARGRVELDAGPSFRALRLERVRLGDWLDAGVTISARGPGQPPAIAVTDGTVDLRRAELDGGGGGGGARGPVTLRLDRLTLTDTIALRPVAVDLAAGSALSGTFRGQMNGGVTVEGQLSGAARGTAIRVTSRDAGAILRDAGLVSRVQGGRLDLRLQPTGAEGTYDGQVRVTSPVLRDAPAMAELLSAISVVGLLEQLQSDGIPFEEVSAEFRISPRQVALYRSSAVGASLGLSMDGTYDMVSKRMDMQGVVSPLYLLNRVGAIFTRRGEGLFGVNFTLRGPVTAPQVAANPLSILTPGMFREIFRRPPPERAAP